MFGGLRLEHDGREVDLGRPRQRFVLAVLAIEANRVVATDRLTDLLWKRDGEKERASLHAYISNLRRVLEPERERATPSTVLVRQSPGYRLVIPRAQIDALRFEDLVEQGIASRDIAVLREAIGLWADPLPEMAAEPVVVEAVGRWRGLLGAALEAAADLHLRAGDAAAAEQLLAPHLSAFPLRERMAALAALALYRTGRQADALRGRRSCPFRRRRHRGTSRSGATSRPSHAGCSSNRLTSRRVVVVRRLLCSGETTSSPRCGPRPPGSANGAEASSPSWGRRGSADRARGGA